MLPIIICPTFTAVLAHHELVHLISDNFSLLRWLRKIKTKVSTNPINKLCHDFFNSFEEKFQHYPLLKWFSMDFSHKLDDWNIYCIVIIKMRPILGRTYFVQIFVNMENKLALCSIKNHQSSSFKTSKLFIVRWIMQNLKCSSNFVIKYLEKWAERI